MRLGIAQRPETVAAEGRPSLEQLSAQFADAGAVIYLCPVCFTSRGLDAANVLDNARIAGGAALWAWIGEGEVPVFTY